MGIFPSLMLFSMIVVTGVPRLQAKTDSPALSYWEEKLPNTPIPSALRQLVVPSGRGIGNVSVLTPNKIVGEIHYSDPANEMFLDPSLYMYFLEKDLLVATKMSLSLVQRSNPAKVYFLPRHLSDKIPFSSDKLSVALEELSIPDGSQAALIMKDSIEECESPVLKEASKYCATSLESMVDYATSRLGTKHVHVLGTNAPKNSMKQQFTFTAVPFQSKLTSKTVVCHRQPYAYAVYYCHEPSNTKAVQVSLTGEDGSSAKAVGLCHEDTSWWNPNHSAFKLLNVKPGGPSVCHFIPEDEVIWVSGN